MKHRSITLSLIISTLFLLLLQTVPSYGSEITPGEELPPPSLNPTDHGDAYWAALAQDAEPFDVNEAELRVAAMDELDDLGSWDPVLAWPHIPVSASILPDGRVMTWSSNDTDGFPGGQPEQTYTGTWDPETGQFDDMFYTGHDMFCAHNVLLEDGTLFAMGGRNTVVLTSQFDYETDTWYPTEDMHSPRWYPTSVALPNGEVFVASGSGGGTTAETWSEGNGWDLLSNINWGEITQENGWNTNWWPYLHVAPNGQLFHSGPTETMHWVDTTGEGNLIDAGLRPNNGTWYPKYGNAVMYDEGKILIVGGQPDIDTTDDGAVDRAISIDVNGASPVVTELNPMQYARSYSNAVILPNGEVMVIGGNTSGRKFVDDGAQLTPEIWNPDTGVWTAMADMSIPRNYHSVALLLPDGRVWSGGGGLCNGCAGDHQDAQVFNPPYLFDANGNLAPRPAITNAPAVIKNGQNFTVNTSENITEFGLVRMSSVTHGVNTDQRFLTPPMADLGGNQYELTAHDNWNVLTPGYWMLFAMNSNGIPSEAHVIQVSTEGIPKITSPGQQFNGEGDVVSVTVPATDSDGDPLTYSATNLPPGLSINSSTGEISGTVASDSSGEYAVEVTVTDGESSPTITIIWTITPEGTGLILREWWTGIDTTSISEMTGDDNFPQAASGTAYETLFEAPTNWADDYGTRMRGFIHPTVTGEYTFWISSDDNGELWLSSDNNPANVTQIASVPGWSASRTWDKYAEQQSALVVLEAGKTYYIEALMKENGGGDNLAVAWQQPGGELEVIGGLYLSPAEVQHTNVALGGTATQSSTFVSSFEFDASNAIDGNTNGDDAANAMTHTNNDLEAWWEVDLGASHYIDLIRIWNRTDCCSDRLSDFYVLVSDAPFTSTNLNTTLNQAGVDAFYFTGAAGTTENFFTRANGRYVRVQLSGQNFLQLAEVEIFGQPSSAFPAQADLTVSLDSADRNFGTAAQDSAAGTGYLMYSVESIHTRFSANAPHPDNDNHFIAVKYINDAWHYDNNNDYFPFTPISTDLLVASVDFSADSGSVLQGANAYVEGMLSGYATGNISITADLWNSATNDGEFTISGSYFVRNSELPVTNVAPVITDPGAQTTAEGATISLDIEATDGDGDELTYSASGLPGTAVMNATTGLIEGYVEAGDAGNYSVTVVVNDNTDSSTLTFDWTITAAPGGWVDYADETASRLSYTANSFEKDTAVGDLNNDGWDDVVVVHKTSFDIAGQQADTLLMNVDGVLVDQTATYAPAMLTNLTDARDVLLNDVDSDGWLDIIIATTFEDPPALYRNLGNDGAGNWLGFANESGRLPATFDTSTVQFCAITAGDVNGDGHEDLYFANYAMDGGAKDVLLINDGNGNFTEESQARLGDYRWSAFGTSAQIIDMDNDGDNEIVKLSAEYGVHPWGHAGIFTLFNDGAGNFTSYDEIPSADPYMFWIDDLNNDGLNDLFVQDDAQDYVQLGSGFTANSEVTFNQSNLTAVQTSDHGGNFRFADLDGDGDLDMGIADVDTMWPPCDTGADSFRKFTLLINDGTGQMSDPYGGAKHVWSQNTFDFDFIDIDRDGNLDIFAAQCDGYAVYMNTAAPTINQPPILTNTADQNSNEGDTISLTISATDADGDTLTYSATGLPTELSINSTTGEIAGTLGFFSEGSYTVNVTVTDGTITDSDSFTWTISGSNQAPTVANPGDQTSSEGDAVSLQISGSDPDGDGLTYSATGLPTDLSIDSAGLIAGTLGYESAGSYSVTVTVSDGVLTDSETFNWTINNTNRAPSLINPGAQANDEDDTVSLNITASDADGDTLTYSATGLPAGLSLNTTTGEITGTATPAGDFTVIVTVSDGTASADATFDWTVTAVAPPTEDNETVYFSITGSGFVGASVSFVDEDIVAYDTINDEWSLYFDGSDVGLNVSGNADIDAVHVREDGSILFSIRATETLPDVGEITNADLILFTPTSLGETTAGTFSMYLDGSDVGLTGGGEDITAVYEMANGDLIISTVGTNNVGTLGNLRDEDLLRFSGSYGDTTSGTWSLYFDGSDADMLASTEEFYGVSVDENSSEIFLSNRGTFDLGGITGDASDVAVCQSAVTGENSSCSYALFLDGGAIGLDNEVIDGLSVLRTTSVPGNQAPIINNPGAQTNTEGDGISLTITATDGDGDTLTFSQTGLPTGLSINSSSGEISGTATTAGDYSVTVSVDDGTESRSASFDWEIVEPNVAPVVTNPGAQANDEGETISLAIVATDGNSDALTYSASDLPTGLAINASTGEISGVLNYESAGSYTVSIDVTDGIETSSVSFSWTVNDVEPPAGSATIYVSSTSSGNAGGLSFVDEDIIAYDPTTDSWSMYFDGSDVGFGGNSALDTSAFHVRADGSILLAIRQDNEVADLGIVENSDILLFTPTSTGDTTAGTFSIYLDGSDVDLSSGGESITAISELSNGDLVISTIGSNNVGTLGTQRDEDLLLFSGTYGENTSGTWSFYFDGSDAELTDSTEEIHAVSVDPITGDIVMVMRGAFTVTGASGGASDLVGCYAPTTGENSSCAYAIYATGVELGINGENIDGLSIGN